jgi:hypothetical protein
MAQKGKVARIRLNTAEAFKEFWQTKNQLQTDLSVKY